jgi:hypothetical protein
MKMKELFGCFRKHISLALSYARECSKSGGHGRGGKPDHRADLSGELMNAEIHSSVINQTMTLKLRDFRRSLQEKQFCPDSSDIDKISTFWFASYFIEKSHEEIKELSRNDPEFALMIVEKYKIYTTYRQAPETSDVMLSCRCHRTSNPDIRKQDSFPTKIVSFGLNDAEKTDLENNLREFLSGFSGLDTPPAEEECFPCGLKDDGQSLYVLWPKEVRLIRNLNAYHLPSIECDGEFDREDLCFLNTSDAISSLVKFYKLPLLVFPKIVGALCGSYLRLTGRKKFGDFYSVYRCFINQHPCATIGDKAFVYGTEPISASTVYLIKTEEVPK